MGGVQIWPEWALWKLYGCQESGCKACRCIPAHISIGLAVNSIREFEETLDLDFSEGDCPTGVQPRQLEPV